VYRHALTLKATDKVHVVGGNKVWNELFGKLKSDTKIASFIVSSADKEDAIDNDWVYNLNGKGTKVSAKAKGGFHWEKIAAAKELHAQ